MRDIMSGDDITQVNQTSARLREAFDTLAEMAPAERNAWLEAHISNPGERTMLLRLLAADDSGGYLDTPAAEHAARLAAEEIAPGGLIGRQIGAFKVLAPVVSRRSFASLTSATSLPFRMVTPSAKASATPTASAS